MGSGWSCCACLGVGAVESGALAKTLPAVGDKFAVLVGREA